MLVELNWIEWMNEWMIFNVESDDDGDDDDR